MIFPWLTLIHIFHARNKLYPKKINLFIFSFFYQQHLTLFKISHLFHQYKMIFMIIMLMILVLLLI